MGNNNLIKEKNEFITMFWLSMITILGISNINGYYSFLFTGFGFICGMMFYVIMIKLRTLKKDLKIKKFLTTKEYDLYQDILMKDIRNYNDNQLLKMVNDYLTGKLKKRENYNIQFNNNEYLLESFQKKYGNINPEDLLN